MTSKRRESSIIQKHLFNRPKLEEVIAKNILDVPPEIVEWFPPILPTTTRQQCPPQDPETAHAMKRLKRVRDMIILNRRIPLRPTPQHLYDRNIAPRGAFGSKGPGDAMKERKRRRDKSIYALNQLFRDRPGITDLQKIIHPLVGGHCHDHCHFTILLHDDAPSLKHADCPPHGVCCFCFCSASTRTL